MNAVIQQALLSRRGPVIALGLAIGLLALGLLAAALGESGYRAQKAREIDIQAQIVAASVAPALMFDDQATATEYLSALGANPEVQTAAVYDATGAPFARFARGEREAPQRLSTAEPATVRGGTLSISTEVVRDGERLGYVHLATRAQSWVRGLSRYAAIGVIVLLAALFVVVFGLAQGALVEANAALSERALELQREIEQREKVEEALLQSRKLEAIGQLTGGVAHDFNNLLMVVIGGLSMLDRQADPERRARTLEAIRQAAERGAGLARQLLAFARKQTLKLEPVDVAARLSGMRELLERSLRADVLVDIRAPAGLFYVRTDPAQFELAILNLAVNARDAMPKGGLLTIEAENRSEHGADFVDVTVRDTGHGMPPDVLERVFEPYFTTKQAGQGTGLGLSQVYGIATQSGGGVRIESVVGEGTAVIVRLPRSEVAPATALPKASDAGAGLRVRGCRVLVVEDDDRVAETVMEMIAQVGCRAERAANAEAALRRLATDGDFDLVFSDMIMPGAMNGAELANEIRKRLPGVPVLLTTGYSGAAIADIDCALLRKPYELAELERALEDALGKAPRNQPA